MRARLYTPADYATVEKWWDGHGVQRIAANVLPELGVVMEDECKPLAMCWIYLALGVGVAWLAWTTSNPDLPPFTSAKALKALVDAAQKVTPVEYGLMVAMPQQESYKRLLESSGFVFNHPAYEMFKVLPR